MKYYFKKFDKLKSIGKTAIGPALKTSYNLALKGGPGSTIMLCTDGLANVGIGALDN